MMNFHTGLAPGRIPKRCNTWALHETNTSALSIKSYEYFSTKDAGTCGAHDGNYSYLVFVATHPKKKTLNVLNNKKLLRMH